MIAAVVFKDFSLFAGAPLRLILPAVIAFCSGIFVCKQSAAGSKSTQRIITDKIFMLKLCKPCYKTVLPLLRQIKNHDFLPDFGGQTLCQ